MRMNAIRPPGLETDDADARPSASASEPETQETLPLEDNGGLPTNQELAIDFDWRDGSDIVIHEQPETAVYLNPKGAVVIRQRCWPDDDSYVYFFPEHSPAIVAAIRRLVGI